MILGNENIVWLASYPKSGNTWFRILLANYLSESDGPININELGHSIIASSRIFFDNIMGTNSSDLSLDEINALRPLFYRSISLETKETIYIKVHDAWEKNNLSEPLFPVDVTKAAIYIVRNPLDVAVSFAFHRSIPIYNSLSEMDNDTNSLCGGKKKLHNQLKQNLLSWSKHVTSWITDSNLPIHIIRYEDLLFDPFTSFSKALDFLNLDISESKIRTSVKHSQIEVLRKQEELSGFREKPIGLKSFFRYGSSGNWKEHLNMEQISSFLDNNKTLMDRFNYSY